MPFFSPLAISPYNRLRGGGTGGVPIGAFSSAFSSAFNLDYIPPLDTDAQAFIDAATITGTTQQNALNQLVLDLKGTGSTTNNTDVWNIVKAYYPMCPIDGSTATLDGFKYNLKDPRDLDAAFRIGWVNTPTATYAGVVGNGTNQYGNLNISSIDAWTTINDACFGTKVTSAGGGVDMGYYAGATTIAQLRGAIGDLYLGGLSSRVLNNNGYGIYIGNRASSAALDLYYEDGLVGSDVTLDGNLSAAKFAICARGGNSIAQFSNGVIPAAFIMQRALTQDEITDLTIAINKFDTALGR